MKNGWGDVSPKEDVHDSQSSRGNEEHHCHVLLIALPLAEVTLTITADFGFVLTYYARNP